MKPAILFTLLFLGGAGYGAYRGHLGLRKMRSRRRYPGVLIEWADHLPSGPFREGLVWVAPAIHFIAMTVIATATLLAIPQRASSPVLTSFSGVATGLSHDLIVGLSLVLIAYLWGVTLAVNPFYLPFHRVGHFALSAEGVLYGGRLYPWSRFSHFTTGEPGDAVRLWSASSPGLVLFTFLPRSATDHHALTSALPQFLPNAPSQRRSRSWPIWFLPVLMAGTAITALTATFLLLPGPGLFGLPATAGVALVFVVLGGRMIMHLAFGGLGQPADSYENGAA